MSTLINYRIPKGGPVSTERREMLSAPGEVAPVPSQGNPAFETSLDSSEVIGNSGDLSFGDFREISQIGFRSRLHSGLVAVRNALKERLTFPNPMAGSIVVRNMFDIVASPHMSETVGNERIVVGQSTDSLRTKQDLLQDFALLRTELVRREGWIDIPDDSLDSDRYDTDPNTSYLLSLNKKGRLIAGTRLTKLDRLDGALSDEMWQNAYDEQFVYDFSVHELINSLNQAGEEGRLYDLTRLATSASILDSPGRADFVAARDGVLEVISLIRQNTNEGAKILCTVNTDLLKSLRKIGLVIDEVKRGRISVGDDYECHFCIIDREASIKKISDGNKLSKAAILD